MHPPLLSKKFDFQVSCFDATLTCPHPDLLISGRPAGSAATGGPLCCAHAEVQCSTPTTQASQGVSVLQNELPRFQIFSY